MKYPQRPSTHIKETASWKILQNSVPSEWMVRGVSERDYGVDCYIEMVGWDGSVRGDLLSIQLKGTESLNWKHNDKQKRREAKFSGIKIETINVKLVIRQIWTFKSDRCGIETPIMRLRPCLEGSFKSDRCGIETYLTTFNLFISHKVQIRPLRD